MTMELIPPLLLKKGSDSTLFGNESIIVSKASTEIPNCGLDIALSVDSIITIV